MASCLPNLSSASNTPRRELICRIKWHHVSVLRSRVARLTVPSPEPESEDMPDRMSEDMPYSSEDIPDRMSEDMPDSNHKENISPFGLG